jgi:4-hydroxybenzoate polyprenyltransferase
MTYNNRIQWFAVGLFIIAMVLNALEIIWCYPILLVVSALFAWYAKRTDNVPQFVLWVLVGIAILLIKVPN